MTPHTDTEALDKLQALADELDHIGAGTPEYAAPEAVGEGATAIRSLIAELRQERERAAGWASSSDVHASRATTAEVALSRAEETIESAYDAFNLVSREAGMNILHDYLNKQKEADQ